MEHVYFFDGNEKRISWSIQNENSIVEQYRDQPEIYLDKVSVEQSKYIALHAGMFWCIGRFIIKNGDTVKVMLDSKLMYERLVGGNARNDSFIEARTGFLKQLIDQRKLTVRYELIEPEKNIATKLLST
ncbi:MAG: hypothetical protein HY295_07565 [Thaumarchaeota archaeon]|nr:hypothetical protein [Nitrososphaerota archaeon]